LWVPSESAYRKRVAMVGAEMTTEVDVKVVMTVATMTAATMTVAVAVVTQAVTATVAT